MTGVQTCALPILLCQCVGFIAFELKSEIGGDVILFEGDEPDALAQHIEQRFGLQAAVIDNQVRLEIENGHRFVTDVVEAFPGEIEGVSVHKPSLEDVFIRRTGHRFWTEQDETSD